MYLCILIIQSCCTGPDGYIRHKSKANRTLQAYTILRLHNVVNSATGALPDILYACSVMSCFLVPVVVFIIHYGLSKNTF